MTDQATVIGIGVDSTEAVTAGVALDKMAASGAASESVFRRLATAASEFAGGLRQGAVQALDEHRKTADLASAATKNLGDTTAASASKISSGIDAATGSLKSFLLGAVSGATIMAAINSEFGKFNKQIDSLAKLNDTSQVIGETVEKLSALQGVAEVTGFSFDLVTSSISRLTKSLSSSKDENKGAAYALKQLGIESRDTEGKIRSGTVILTEVAKALSTVKDSSEKAAYVQAIYGRGAAELVPYLNNLAKANGGVATATAEQTQASNDYLDAQRAFAQETTKLYNVIAGAVLPVFTKVIEAMTEAKGKTESLGDQVKRFAADGSLQKWAEQGVLAAAYVIDSFLAVPAVFKIVGAGLAGLVYDIVAANDAVAGLLYAGINIANPIEAIKGANMAREAYARIGQGASMAKDDVNALAEAFTRGSFVQKAKDAFAPDALKMYNAELEKTETTLPAFTGKQEKATKAARDFSDSIRKSIEALELSNIKTEIKINTIGIDSAIDALNKLRTTTGDSEAAIAELSRLQAQKFAESAREISLEKDVIIKTIDAITAAKVKADAAGNTKGVIAANAEYRKEMEKLNGVNVAAAKLEADKAKATNDNAAAVAKLVVEEGKRFAALRDSVSRELEENEAIKRSTEEIGKNESQINELNIARLQTKLLLAQVVLGTEMATELDIKSTDAIKDQIAALKERGGLLDAKAIVQNAEDTRKALDTTWRGIGDDLTNYVLSGFQNTRALLKRMFETLVLRPIISPITNALASGLQGLLGGGGGASGGLLSSLFGGGGDGGGLGSLLGLGGGLAGIASGITAGLVGPGSAIGTALGLGSAVGAPTFLAGAGVAGGAGTIAGTISTVLSAIPVIGWIALAAAAAYAIFGKDETGIKIDNSVTDGRGRKDIIRGAALGDFDVSGDIGNEAFKPLVDTVFKLDKLIADNLLKPSTIDTVRANIQRISSDATDWFGFEDAAGAKVAIEKASKLFLQQRYSVAFDEIDTSVAQMIRTFDGSADELIKFIGTAVVAKGVIDELNKALPKLNVSLGAYLQLTEQQQQDLATIAQLMPLLGQNIAQLGADAYTAQTRGIVDSFIAQGDALDTLIDRFNAGNASINDLASATVAFGDSAIQVIAALASARDNVDTSVAGGIRNIQTTGLDREALNTFLSNEAEALRGQLAVTTDPAKIQDLVNRIIANSTQVFSSLTPEEQVARRGEFITGLQTLQKEADARIEKLSNLVAKNTETQLGVVKGILESAADKIVKSADTTAAAVDKFDKSTDKFDDTVDKGIHVVVDLEKSNVGGL